jgi:hypothetical protein
MEEVAARGGLRLALRGGQRFGEEAQVRAVLEEVALAQPDRRWLARKRAALQCGSVAEQGTMLCGNCEQGARERRVVRASQARAVRGEGTTHVGATTTATSGGRSVVRAAWHGGRCDQDAMSHACDR